MHHSSPWFISRHSFHSIHLTYYSATHLTLCPWHHSYHTRHLTPHLTPLISNHSSHTTHLTSLKDTKLNMWGYPVLLFFVMLFWCQVWTPSCCSLHQELFALAPRRCISGPSTHCSFLGPTPSAGAGQVWNSPAAAGAENWFFREAIFDSKIYHQNIPS